jgi:hypothetical protein
MISRIHAWAVRQSTLRTFTVVVRVLLVLAFVPSGLVKIVGEPFTALPVADPVGRFFAGFFATGGYYRFIGVAQWVAGALLLFPRTAALGALVYLPISINIFAITLVIGSSFGGTRIVAGAMVAANVYLVWWDWDRWQGLVPAATVARARHGDAAVSVGMLIGAGLAFAGLTGVHLARLGRGSYAAPLAELIAGASFAALMLVIAYRRAHR